MYVFAPTVWRLELRFCRHFSVTLTSAKNWSNFCSTLQAPSATSLNFSIHTYVPGLHRDALIFHTMAEGKNQHLDLSHVIYQSNETGDYGSFFVSNAWFLPLCTPYLHTYVDCVLRTYYILQSRTWWAEKRPLAWEMMEVNSLLGIFSDLFVIVHSI